MVNRSKRIVRVALVLAAMSITWSAGSAPADAAVRDCSVYDEVPNRALSHAGVTSVRNMSCRSARRAIRRHGRHQTNAAYRDAGSRFGLGPWSCTVYFHNYELWKARCVRGTKAFRVEYGF
jgi:hypothetical protein